MKILFLAFFLTACGTEGGDNSFNGTEKIPNTPPFTTEEPKTVTPTTVPTVTPPAAVPKAIEKELKLYTHYINEENRGTEIGTVTLANGKYVLSKDGHNLPLTVAVRENGEVISSEVTLSLNADSQAADKVFDNLACEQFSTTGAYTFIKKVSGVTNKDYLQIEKTVDNHYRLFYTGREKTAVTNHGALRNNSCISVLGEKFYQVLFTIIDLPFEMQRVGNKMVSDNLTLISKAK